MVRSSTQRLSEKTAEKQLLHELESDFELAPAMSRAVLETVQQVLLPRSADGEIREGQMRVTAVSDREPGGKPLAATKKVAVVVTVDSGLEDLEGARRFFIGLIHTCGIAPPHSPISPRLRRGETRRD